MGRPTQRQITVHQKSSGNQGPHGCRNWEEDSKVLSRRNFGEVDRGLIQIIMQFFSQSIQGKGLVFLMSALQMRKRRFREVKWTMCIHTANPGESTDFCFVGRTLLLPHTLPSLWGAAPAEQASLSRLQKKQPNPTSESERWEEVLRTQALLALFLYLKEACVLLCASMSHIRSHTMPFCHLWLMGILPNSTFKMRKSTCKQIKATLPESVLPEIKMNFGLVFLSRLN